MYVSLEVRVIAASKCIAARDSVTVVPNWICDASTFLAFALFVFALLQVIVISVSGQTDTVQGQDQNNVTVSKKKKTTTASKRKEGEKKGKSSFTFVVFYSSEKIVKHYTANSLCQSIFLRSQTIKFTVCMLLINNKCKVWIARLNLSERDLNQHF